MEKAQRQLETILLIKSLGDGKANPFLDKPKRKRISFTPLWIVYQIHLYQKNVDRGKWKDIHTMKETIAANAGISRTSVTNFFNSKIIGSDLFVGIARYLKRTKGKFQSNRYWLKEGIAEALHFLERKGFFKNFKSDPVKWRKGFEARLESWLIPLLEKGLTLEQIFKGELSIRSQLSTAKLSVVEPPKLAYTTLPPEESFTTHRHLDNPVAIADFEIPEIGILHGKLIRLDIPKWQIKNFMLHNSLSILSAATDNTIKMTNGGWQPDRMPALLQSNINRYEKRQRHNL